MSSNLESLSGRPANRLLCIAAAGGVEAAVRLHIARGDDLEGRDKRGLTPLMIAASKNRPSICRLLLQAGVDAGATDANGRNAYGIALDTGSLAAAEAILEALPHFAPLSPIAEELAAAQAAEPRQPTVEYLDADQDFAQELLRPSPSKTEVVLVLHDPLGLLGDGLAEPDPAPALGALAKTQRPQVEVEADATLIILTEVTSFEGLFGDWEPAIETAVPTHDVTLAVTESERQRRIDEHEPIDHSATWNDFEAELPEFAKPLPRANDGEFRADLRRLLLLATREGSVPRVAVEDLLSARGDAEDRNLEVEARLEFVIGALGAELDEREESSLGNETFEVFVDPVETSSEEREVDDALAMFESLGSGHNDPLRIYQRTIQQASLLTREREAELAKAMEAAVGHAVQFLAGWPEGLRCVLEAAAGAESNPSILWPIVATAREEIQLDGESVDAVDDLASAPYVEETDLDEAVSDSAVDNATDSVVTIADAIGTFRIIKGIVDSSTDWNSNTTLVAEQLGKLSFRRPYLARLADHAPFDQSPEAAKYRYAIADLLTSRDEMTAANLRLVHGIARRYFYSGVPVEDLIQEGNIGLMKAIDRFDWRRGLKFSTMATWWIKQQVSRSIADLGSPIRLPIHTYDKASKLRQAYEAFERSNGRPPTPEQRAEMIGLSVAKMETISRPLSEAMTIEEAQEFGKLDLGELPDPMEIVAEKEVAQVISKRLATLGRKPEAIVRMHMGIGLDKTQTLEEIGASLDLTRERVRQIEAKALKSFLTLHAREELAIALGWPLPKKSCALVQRNQGA